MTKRRYYKEPWQFEATARVTSCESKDDGLYEITLDETIIFPEGGGQISDKGTISGSEVIRCADCGEEIVYTIDKPLSVGQEVQLTIDPDTRRDHSRTHSGEHILSGILKREFNASNVGFHMGEDYATIDMDRELGEDELRTAELMANKAVMENLPVHINMVLPESLSAYTLRKDTSKLQEGEQPVRIVYIGDEGCVDACACCGTHVERSGEIGYISITGAKRYKSGMRIWFLCGERAVKDAHNRRAALDKIALNFSTGASDAYDAVMRQSHELAQRNRLLKETKAELFSYRAQELLKNAKEVRGAMYMVAHINGDASDAKLLSDAITASADKKIAAIVLAQNDQSINYVVATSDGVTPNAKELCEVINSMLSGRGGGRGNLAQGAAKAMSDSELEQSKLQLETYFRNALMR